MKKLLLLAALLLPAVPSFLAGINTTNQMSDDRRAAMLEQRFICWCSANGYSYYTMQRSERERLYLDVWSELDDYQAAQDSIDSVFSAQRRDYLLK